MPNDATPPTPTPTPPAPGATPGSPPAPGSAPPAWYGEIPAEQTELQAWVANKKFESPIAALQSAHNLEKLIGLDRAGRVVTLPKGADDAEGLKAFREKMGVPEKADAYELPFDAEKDTPESKEFRSAVSQWMLANNIPKSAAQSIVKNFDEFVAAQEKAQGEAAAKKASEALESLKGEWGKQFEARAESARRYVNALGFGDDYLTLYEETFGTARMLTHFDKLGQLMGEHGFKASGAGGAPGMTVEKAKSRVEEIRSQRANKTITDAQWSGGVEREWVELNEFLSRRAA